MAYLGHSQHHAYHASKHALGHGWPVGLIARSGVVAFCAAAAVIALTGATPPAETVAAKGDRATAPRIAGMTAVAGDAVISDGKQIRRDGEGRVVYVNDPAARTTTVARGAAVPVGAGSPMGATAE